MTTNALVSLILSYTDNVPQSDADYATRRARVLQLLQEVGEEVWNFTDLWAFSYKRDTAFSLTASAAEVDLPSDFLEIGRHGSLYENSGDHTWLEVGLQELSDIRDGSTVTTPKVFCIYGYNTATDRRRIQVLPAGSTRTMTLIYRFLFPTLVDDATSAPIPSQYHNTVLLAGVIAKTRETKNELRDWRARYEEGLARMQARELPGKSAVHKMPRAVNNW